MASRRPENPWYQAGRPALISLVVAMGIGWYNDTRKVASQTAQNATLADTLPGRRDREMDALIRCTERQIDLIRACPKCSG